jgi:hypothetical protein
LIQRRKQQIGTGKKHRSYERKADETCHGSSRGDLGIWNADVTLVWPGIVPYSRTVRNRRSPRNNATVSASTLTTTQREVL